MSTLEPNEWMEEAKKTGKKTKKECTKSRKQCKIETGKPKYLNTESEGANKMKEQEARARGYHYSSISDLGINNDFSKRREEIKKLGYKSVIVNERVSQYSRSCPGMAYRVLYIEQRYFDDREIGELEWKINSREAKLLKAKEAYEAEVAKIESETQRAIDRKNELKAKYAK